MTVAWLAFLLGISASVAANVAHADARLGPRVAAAFAPLALLAVTELAVSSAWRSGWLWNVARWGGTGIVAGVAGVVSYAHTNGLMRSYGESDTVAIIAPLAPDGLMLVAAAALLSLSREHAKEQVTSETVPWSERFRSTATGWRNAVAEVRQQQPATLPKTATSVLLETPHGPSNTAPETVPATPRRKRATVSATFPATLRLASATPLETPSETGLAVAQGVSNEDAARQLAALYPNGNASVRETMAVLRVGFPRVAPIHKLADEIRSQRRQRAGGE